MDALGTKVYTHQAIFFWCHAKKQWNKKVFECFAHQVHAISILILLQNSRLWKTGQQSFKKCSVPIQLYVHNWLLYTKPGKISGCKILFHWRQKRSEFGLNQSTFQSKSIEDFKEKWGIPYFIFFKYSFKLKSKIWL